MNRPLRPGAVGAMMDEYERAASELSRLLETISEEDFAALRDTVSPDENCRSIRTVLRHVVRAGYTYADYIRTAFAVESARPDITFESCADARAKLAEVIAYTVATLEGKWRLTDDEIMAVQVTARWGPVYDLEQLLEHAIVHILRHRRQIERFLSEPEFAPKPTI